MGVTGLATFILGGNESFAEEIAAITIDAWAFSNSRDAEREADGVALATLEKAGLNKVHVVRAMERLYSALCRTKDQEKLARCIERQETGWMDTHPGGKERLDYLRKSLSHDQKNLAH